MGSRALVRKGRGRGNQDTELRRLQGLGAQGQARRAWEAAHGAQASCRAGAPAHGDLPKPRAHWDGMVTSQHRYKQLDVRIRLCLLLLYLYPIKIVCN